MSALTREQVEELRERSKDDRAIIVGSEVRQLCALALSALASPPGAAVAYLAIAKDSGQKHLLWAQEPGVLPEEFDAWVAARYNSIAPLYASPISPPAQEGKPRCICKGIASLRECPVHGWANNPSDIRSRRDDATTPRLVDEPEVVQTAPKRIWIQISDEPSDMNEPFPSTLTEDMTWCDSPMLACEVAYVRADLATPRPAGSAE